MRAARKNLLPNRDRILFYSDGKEVIPGIQAMHTRHTVGLTCFVITSGSDTLYFAGDLAHHNVKPCGTTQLGLQGPSAGASALM